MDYFHIDYAIWGKESEIPCRAFREFLEQNFFARDLADYPKTDPDCDYTLCSYGSHTHVLDTQSQSIRLDISPYENIPNGEMAAAVFNLVGSRLEPIHEWVIIEPDTSGSHSFTIPSSYSNPVVITAGFYFDFDINTPEPGMTQPKDGTYHMSWIIVL